jgi:D-alanyl-lipoteichoic acid acyltransferase DltB (MBOAT superfamily)
MDVNLIDFFIGGFFGWLGTFFVVYGSFLVGRKNKTGWVVHMFASVAFICDFLLHWTMFHMIPINIFMFGLSFYNYSKWNRQEVIDSYLKETPTKDIEKEQLKRNLDDVEKSIEKVKKVL